MVNWISPPGSTSPPDDIEMGCCPTPKGVRPVLSQANWPGWKEYPLWPTGLSTRVRESPRSSRFFTTSQVLFQFRMGNRIL